MAEERVNTREIGVTAAGNGIVDAISPTFLCGRLDIISSVEAITADNVVSEVNSALVYHNTNLIAEEYLYWYRRGLQPVWNRTKERNAFINNKVLINHYEEICAFKGGYFLQQPATYVSRRNGVQRKVDKLNEYVYRSGKYDADNEIADWFHTVGKGVLYIELTPDDDIPFVSYSLDPRSAFVVYSMRPGKRPLYAVNYVKDEAGMMKIDVYTPDRIFRLSGGYGGEKTTPFTSEMTLAVKLDKVDENVLGHIPIIEYRYNSMNEAAPEPVLPILDAISDIESNRADGIAQFIQSIAVAVNCQFDDDVTADKIKKMGMIVLSSIGENKADFKLLTSELNQDQTQTLVDDLYETALRIVCMPTTTKGGRSTADSGQAVIFRDGWEQAGASARNTEDLWNKSDTYYRAIVLDILSRRKLLTGLKAVDFSLNFVREETANIQSKAQSFETLLSSGLHPELAAKKSGISNDPVSDIKMSEKYLKMIWGDPDKVDETEEATTGKGEATIIEEDNNNGEDAVI